MIARVNDIYLHALKLLERRDYTISDLRKKLEAKFGSVPQDVIDQLIRKNFLNDLRFTENYVNKRKNRGPASLLAELMAHGVPEPLAQDVVSQTEWPSLREALIAKMKDWKVRVPFQSRDAARLFRALARLGYDEDAIREEIEQLREP